jgi:hypothetical protein
VIVTEVTTQVIRRHPNKPARSQQRLSNTTEIDRIQAGHRLTRSIGTPSAMLAATRRI